MLASATRTPWFLTTAPEPTPAIARPRVGETIDESVRTHAVVAVGAPSGFGKSTAVAQWAAGTDLPVAWLSLTRFDGDRSRIAHGVIGALRRRLDDTDFTGVVVDADDPAALVDDIAGLLSDRAEEISEGDSRADAGDVVLVVDQAEFAEDIGASVVGALAVKQPPHLRLIVIGTAPGPDLLRALGSPVRARAIGPNVLAFSPEEITDASAVLPDTSIGAGTATPTISPDAASDIRARTGGWPIAVRLELGGAATDETLPLDDYIEDAVLAHLPADLAGIVRETTILSTFTEETARAVSGRSNAGALLDECARRGLFLDRFGDHGRRRYVWHEAFRGAVAAAERRRDPASVRRGHDRAAAALRVSDPLAAVEHLLAADRPEDAYRVILAAWLELLHEGRAATVENVCATLPAPYADTAASLGIRACCAWMAKDPTRARLLGSRGASRTADTPAEQATVHLTTLLTVDDPAVLRERLPILSAALHEPQTIDARMAPHALFVVGYAALRLRKSPIDAIATLQAALREAEAQRRPRLAGRIAGSLSFALAFAGRLSDALAAADRSTEIDLEDEWQVYDGGGAACTVGFVAYWRDDLALARDAFARVRGASHGPTAFEPLALMYDGLSAVAAGDRVWQAEALERLREMPVDTILGVPWRSFRDSALSELAAAAGRHDEALRYARQVAASEDFAPVPRAMAAEMFRRQHLAGESRRVIAETRLGSLTAPARVRMLLTDALLRADAGRDDAHIALETALDAAVPERMLRPFADATPELRALLESHARWGTRHGPFIAEALARKEATDSPTDLSAREREILAYLRTPMTIAEIAAALYLSVNTVKTHVQSVYRKLGVQSRREAVSTRI